MTLLNFPTQISTNCSGRNLPGLSAPELRKRAVDNFYTAERHKGVDPLTAHERAEAFGRDLEVIAAIMRTSK